MKFLRSIGLMLALSGVAGYATTAHAEREMNPEAKDLILKGDAKCTGCHDEADEPEPSMLELHPGVLRIGKTKHGTKADGRTPTCTDCHGESLDHLNYKGSDKPPRPDRVFIKPGLSSAEVRNAACSSCHAKDIQRSHWAGSVHDTRGVACNDCHKIHSAEDRVRDKRTQAEVCYTCHKQQRTAMNKPSHHPVPEGKMSCSDCHNAHGSVGPKLMKRDSVVETCYTCHMEKRGPFVHNHQPVDEDCSICHEPHGTVTESLLKARPPFLCQSCHTPHGAFPPGVATGPAGPGLSGQPGWWNSSAITQGRGCLNCHTQVHGSNNPGLATPTPQRLFR
ncbi:MAG: DmsE family decaheme c-type cytochrome [Gallionellaceae bacterium]|nr:DmsE family decaheme c-type cytochrome [Gallionellaceae bacterium]MDD5367166.1 DmsE family decaheme c-type cytochrome [Gallionellaceae bacterium]